MKQYLIVIAFVFLFIVAFSQTTYKTLQIGDKQIALVPKQMAEVFQENIDTIHIYPEQPRETYGWGRSYSNVVISVDSIILYKERIEEDSDGLKRAYIQTQAIKNKHSYFTDYDLLNDSVACIKTPLRKIDSVYSINMNTLDEEIHVLYDTAPCFKYNLGSISKADFLASAKNKFGNELQLTSMGMYTITDTVIFKRFNLSKPFFYKQIEKVINACKAGAIINLDISHRLSRQQTAYIWNLAFFTLTD